MAYLLTFETALLDPSGESENPHNPIRGSTVLDWLRHNCFSEPLRWTEPEPEDWGWYIDVVDGEDSFLVGGVCFENPEDEPSDSHEWLIQIHKQRSIIDKLLGRNRLSPADPVVALIRDAIMNEPGFAKVEVEEDA
ncbi:MAG: hypothetical protein QNJ19_14980 [Woeseiaceae bacterium]|nr:hypothetical protein [Woeseiaceae bacterium]